MNQIILGIGTNLGKKKENIEIAYNLIQKHVGSISKKSFIYESEAWGITEQPSFLNSCVQIETELNASQVLEKIGIIESEMGRVRIIKWGERIIDIDILYFNSEIIQSENLSVPHPFIYERIFVLKPLNDICPNYIDPKNNASISNLLKECKDNTKIQKLEL